MRALPRAWQSRIHEIASSRTPRNDTKDMFIIFYILFLLTPLPVSADTGHIIISEIQTYGQTATDEFVRLYNPTGAAIDISGWKLAKKTSSGSESNLVSSFVSGTIIPPNSGFLIAHQTGYLGNESPNARYSGASYSFADNNTIILKDASGNIIDKVGFGTAVDFETAPAVNPENGASIKRNNFIDTDNNKNDFGVDVSNTEIPPNPPLPKGEDIVLANYGDIVFNEVVSNPSDGKEWLELYNTTANAISLAGWKISDGSSVIYEPTGEIASNGFFTIETNNRLNNPGDAIYLSDAGGKSISQLIYGDWANAVVSAPEKGQSIVRDASGNYQISTTPTKNAANLFTKSPATADDSVNSVSATGTPIQNPDDIKNYISIIELLPNPADSDTENEYIKIRNAADSDIDMNGLYLDDAEGGSRPWKITAGTIVKAGGDLTFFRSKTGLALNNDADTARILDKNKNELATVEYENAPAGEIYIFQNKKWQWIGVKTEQQTSAAAGNQTSAKSNSVTGVVLIPPNIFSTQTMYVDGLQLYMYSKDWPELKIGDKISVYGTPSTYYSEPRLKLKNQSSIKIISRGNTIDPAPADGISEDDLGRLIIIEGEVLQIANTKIILGANGEEIPVYDKTKQKLFSNLKEKDRVQIAGIVSQYKDEFRLLPRGADDIKITKTAAVPLDKRAPLWQYAISTLAVSSLAAGIYIRRKKK